MMYVRGRRRRSILPACMHGLVYIALRDVYASLRCVITIYKLVSQLTRREVMFKALVQLATPNHVLHIDARSTLPVVPCSMSAAPGDHLLC